MVLSLNDKDLSSGRQLLFAALSLAALVGMIYSNSLHVPFHFDDYQNIQGNSKVVMKDLSWTSIHKTFYGMNALGTRILRPFAYLSFGLNYYAGGHDPFGYHVVNITIHFLAALFLFLLIRETLQLPSLRSRYGASAYPAALLAAVLWAVHPIQTQAVTYVVQRMASMAALFYVASVFFYVKGRLCVTQAKWVYFASSLLAAILAFGTKENTAVLPVMILLYEFLFLQQAVSPEKRNRVLFAIFLAASIPLLLAIIFLGTNVFHDIWVEILEGYKGDVYRNFTPYERVLTQFRVVVYYLTLLLYPAQHRLSLDHDFAVSHSFLDPPTTMLAALLVASLVAVGVKLARRSPLVSFCIFWYFLNLLIESSIFNLELVFEHRLYLPSMSFCLLVSLGIISFLNRTKHSYQTVLSAGLACAFIILQGNGTYVRNFVWQDKYSLWNDCLRKAPAKPRTLQNIGYVYYEMGRYVEAEDLLSRSLRAEPDNVNAINTLGSVYLGRHEYGRALDAFRKAEKLAPHWTSPVANQGNVYLQTGQFKKAEEEYKRSLAIKQTAGTLSDLGRLYIIQSRFSQALPCFAKVIEDHPLYVPALFHMGLAYKGLKRYPEALLCFDKVLAVQPENLSALLGKAIMCGELGRTSDMVAALGELLRLHPFDHNGNLLMGKHYLAGKDYDRAKICLRIAASVNPEAPEPYEYLSELYRGRGNEVLARHCRSEFERRKGTR